MKTSLERSHSKASNFKLTLICLLGAIGFAILFIGISLLNNNTVFINNITFATLAIILLIAGGALSLLSFILIRIFAR